MSQTTDSDFLFETIAVVGVGLIGGSLGMAAKRRGLAGRVIGIGRTEQKLMRAQILGAIDDYTLDLDNGASDADLVIICTPVGLIVPTIQRMAAALKTGAIVTDVGSTKREVAHAAEPLIPEGCHFIGGHPMAGSDKSGVSAAFPDLFLNATYVLTPTQHTDLAALGKLTTFAESIGANAVTMTPQQHDAAVAITSHLPHAMAAALLHVAAKHHRDAGNTLKLAAGSFRDLTRVAGSSPELWRDICLTNADSLCEAVELFQNALETFKKTLQAGNEDEVQQFFEEAAGIRKALLRLQK